MLLRDWDLRESELSLEMYEQYAGHPFDEARMAGAASAIELLARDGLAHFPRESLPPRLWAGMVAHSSARATNELNSALYAKRNEAVSVEVAGERVNVNTWRQFDQRHLHDAKAREAAFQGIMKAAPALTPTLESRFRLTASTWAAHGLTPLDAYLMDERVGLERLKRTVTDAAERARPAFLEAAETFSQEILGKPFAYHDDMYVFRHAIFGPVDRHFADVNLLGSFRRLAEGLGFDLSSIAVDGEARPGKYASPICFGVRIPGDVRVLYQTTTPLGDYESFYHEMGHALHFACVQPARPFEDRRLIPNGVAEIFSTLFEELAFDPTYMMEALGLSRDIVQDILRRRRFLETYFLTFYGANSMFKIHFWEDALYEDLAAADETYAQWTERFMGFALPGIYWQTHHVMSMSDIYAPSYLLAHIRKSELIAHLQSRFGAAWWRAPEAGQYLRDELMGPGASIPLDTFSRLDPAPYVDRVLSGGVA